MKKGVILLILFAYLSFTSAFSISSNVSTKQNQGIGEFLSGNLTLEMKNMPANSIITSDLGEITLRDFFKNNNQHLSCEIFNCSSILTTNGQGASSKQIEIIKDEKILGILVNGMQVSAKNFSISLTSAFGERSKSPIQIQIGNFQWKYTKPSELFTNPRAISYGCYNNTSSSISEVFLNTNNYCEKITLSPSKLYLLGSDISGSGIGDFVMTLKDLYGQDKASCNFSKTTQTSYSDSANCTIKFEEELSEGQYYACIKALTETNFKLKKENSQENCGFYSTSSNGLLSDYSIYAKTPKYASLAGEINFDQSEKESAINAINNYIQLIYSSSCSSGCIIPLKITGDNINLTISNLSLLYNSLDGQTSVSKIYETNQTSLLITLNTTLELEKLNWTLNSTGEKNITAYIKTDTEEEKLFNITIFIKQLPIISGLYPLIAPAGLPETFRVNIKNKGNYSNYEWDFGDNQTAKTSNAYAVHTYENISTYNITIKFGSNEYTDTKSFLIETVSPQDYLNETLDSKKEKLTNFNSKLSTFSTFIKNHISSLINPSSYQTQLEDIEMLKAKAYSIEEFLEIAKTLIQITVPAEIFTSNKKTSTLIYNYNTIDPTILAKHTNEEIESTSEYKPKILEWQQKNIVSKILREEITISNEDDSIRNSLTHYRIELKSSSNNKSYFVIQEDLNKLILDSGISGTDIEDRGTVIELEEEGVLNFDILINGSSNPIMYISPELSLLPVPKIDPNCNHNSICDSNENYKLCRNDCYPIFPTIIWSILILIIFITAYTILQVWYKIRYEKYLFNNREELFNLVSFINTAHLKSTSDKEIEKALSSQGWTNEQIKYAINKSEGKNTGMFEIIPIDKIIAHNEKKKAEILQSQKVKAPINQNERFKQNIYRR
jgi:hypothetical protein